MPHKGDATDYVTMEEENLTEDLVELRLAEEEFRRAEMVEKVAMVGRKSDKLKVEEEKKLESDFDKLMTASALPGNLVETRFIGKIAINVIYSFSLATNFPLLTKETEYILLGINSFLNIKYVIESINISCIVYKKE